MEGREGAKDRGRRVREEKKGDEDSGNINYKVEHVKSGRKSI